MSSKRHTHSFSCVCMSHVFDNRNKFAISTKMCLVSAMVKKLDDSVGDIVEALRRKDILHNTIVVFIADNGGAANGLSLNYASNLPLRGSKFSAWEAGTRVVGLVWTANLTTNVWDGYMHAVDWVPTILGAVNAVVPKGIDGVNLWKNITENKESQRREIFEIDDYTGYGSIISGDYKLIHGIVGSDYSDYYNEDLQGIIGVQPSYTEAIRNSTMYGVLEKLGKILDVDALAMRNETAIDCGTKEFNGCYPTAGK